MKDWTIAIKAQLDLQKINYMTLAKALNCSKGTVSLILNRKVEAKLFQVEIIANVCNIPLSTLFKSLEQGSETSPLVQVPHLRRNQVVEYYKTPADFDPGNTLTKTVTALSEQISKSAIAVDIEPSLFGMDMKRGRLVGFFEPITPYGNNAVALAAFPGDAPDIYKLSKFDDKYLIDMSAQNAGTMTVDCSKFNVFSTMTCFIWLDV